MLEVGSFSFTFLDNVGEKGKKLFSQKTFQLPEKGLVLITGPSGAGKSTFLKLIKGLYPQFSNGEMCGEVTPGKSFFTDKNFLYLFQNPFSQLIYQKPEEEFFFSMENFQMSKEEMEKKRKELSPLFSLDQVWGKDNAVLSNGECQKLVLASLVAINPKVLLLDEPTAFLDPDSRREFYHLLNKLKEDHLYVIS
jgi:energy-coupling factor transporter ATP-binding protein EcfA2